MKIRLNRTLLLTFLITFLTACAATTRTHFETTWTDPGFDAGIVKKVLIIGLTENEAERRLFENNLQQQLRAAGINAIASLDGVTAAQEISQEVFEKAFSGQGIDAVIVSRLVAIDQDTNYVEGRTTLIPTTHYVPGRFIGQYAYYNNFYGYYRQSYREVQAPGYLKTTTIARVETNLYETQNNRMVWSAISKTFDPGSAVDAINSLNSAMTAKLRKGGFFE